MAVERANLLPDLENPNLALKQAGAQAMPDSPDMSGATTEMNEDGGATVTLPGDETPASTGGDHDDNLAIAMEDSNLGALASELVRHFEADKNSRKEWERTYTSGLDLLGIAMEDRTKPWPGACGVYHPVLAEAVVRFEAQAIMELFPPEGPAKTNIIGEDTPERIAQAQRVQTELNYILTKKMTDYRDETESLLFRLPLAGSSFRKVYFNSVYKRPEAKFVAAEDFVVPYGETDLRTAGRYTQVDRVSKHELKRRMASGLYRDIDLSDPVGNQDDIQEKMDEVSGVQISTEIDIDYTILEMHAEIDLAGFEDKDSKGVDSGLALPYIVSIERDSQKILAIYRNWDPKDALKQKRDYFVHYKYMPGLGFYGFGLIHLIGGLAKSSSSILRQLVDAGTLSNLPGGLKARGLRIKGDDSPIRPGEFRDVDVGGATIKDSIAFLPYKEPSIVLYQLLGQIVDEARRVGSIADLEIGDMKQEAPVGTTLALMERALKVMSAVQARNHYSLEQELGLVAKVVAQYMPSQYDYDVGGNFDRRADFTGVDVVPVSDPGATTMSQRVVQYQAVVQLASQSPQVYDMRKLNLDMLNVLGIKDATSLIPDPSNSPQTDPVTENMNIIKGSPVKAFPAQDQEAHLAVHMAFMQDPKIQAMVGQSPQANMIQQAMMAHLADHLAFQYRNQIEEQLGTSLPAVGQPLPPDLEVQVSRLVAQAAPQLLQQHQAQDAQQHAEAVQQDPMVQLQQAELAIKQMQMEMKAELDKAKLMLDAAKADANTMIELAKIHSQQQIEGVKVGSQIGQEKSRRVHEGNIQNAKAGNPAIQNEEDRKAELENTVVGKGIDVAGKLAVERAKPKPKAGGAE